MNHLACVLPANRWIDVPELHSQPVYEMPNNFAELEAPYEEAVQDQGGFYDAQQHGEPKCHPLSATVPWSPQPSTQVPIQITVPENKATTSESTTPDMSPGGDYPHGLMNVTPALSSGTTSKTVSPITPTYPAGPWCENGMPLQMLINSHPGRVYPHLISPLEHHPVHGFDYSASPSSTRLSSAQDYYYAHTLHPTPRMTGPYNAVPFSPSMAQYSSFGDASSLQPTQHNTGPGFRNSSLTNAHDNSDIGMQSHQFAILYQEPQKLFEDDSSNPSYYGNPPATENIPRTVMQPAHTLDGSSKLFCLECGKGFTGKYQKGNLKRHIKETCLVLAKDKTIWKCRDCPLEYKRKDARRKHEWKKHQRGERPEKRRPEKK